MREVPLTRGRVALVDDEDYEEVARYKWCYMTAGYAARSVVKEKKRWLLYMHREILKPPKGKHVDHVNGDTLDNRRSNLRLATHAENMRNSKKLSKNNTSGYKGVAFDRSTGNWKAYISVDGKLKHLGRFSTAEAASECYEHHAKLIFKEFKRN